MEWRKTEKWFSVFKINQLSKVHRQIFILHMHVKSFFFFLHTETATGENVFLFIELDNFSTLRNFCRNQLKGVLWSFLVNKSFSFSLLPQFPFSYIKGILILTIALHYYSNHYTVFNSTYLLSPFSAVLWMHANTTYNRSTVYFLFTLF